MVRLGLTLESNVGSEESMLNSIFGQGMMVDSQRKFLKQSLNIQAEAVRTRAQPMISKSRLSCLSTVPYRRHLLYKFNFILTNE